ncbi:TA system VapC family ribonuclease toxin [Candidatus Palauibacter sp.]|uniref:TA system VapC family ribonuclease toxin n=1 Tax=Candidatus Palauibacter sp. TaxID=3101350 RepID=UPI003AF23386
MIRLLDVNVLVALAWPNHIHHGRAHAWFPAIQRQRWATCPVTETGFVRVSSNPRAIPDARTPSEAIALLRRIRALPGHVFWTDDVSPGMGGTTPFGRVVGYRQVTDAHLLALAISRKGRLATFDRGVSELIPDGLEGTAELIPE